MKFGGKTLIRLVCVMALALKVKAAVNGTTPATEPLPSDTTTEDSADSKPPAITPAAAVQTEPVSPYSAIWLRNVFDLKPFDPPPQPKPKPETNAPPPNVDLTGITTIFGNKKALFMLQEPGSPGKPAKQPESFILTEGQRQGALEVMEINPKARTVKIKNDGIVSTLSLTNKPTLMAAGAPGLPPNMGGPPRGPGGFNRQPGANPGVNPGGFNPGAAPIPVRPVRSNNDFSQVSPQGNYSQPNYQAQGNYAQPMYAGGGYQGGVSAGGLQVNTGNSATPGVNIPNLFNQPQSAINNAPQETVPAEVTAALVAAQTQHYQSIGVPTPPPPPGMNIPGEVSSQSPGTAPGYTPPAPPLGSRVTGTAAH